MKQQVKRVNLGGEWEEISFGKKALRFFVKNLSEGDVLITFENDGKEDEAFKIVKGTGEEVAISYGGANDTSHATDRIFAKGTGEIEVQELDWRD